MRRRAQTAFATVGLASILFVVFASIAVLQFEPAHADANIRTASDALWWAWTTVTSVGYGDRYPITSEGRIIGAVLMTVGVGLFGTFTGFVASWFARRRCVEVRVGDASDPAAVTCHRVFVPARLDLLCSLGGSARCGSSTFTRPRRICRSWSRKRPKEARS
jgi:hypothetical protein